ncbi:MAG: adenylate/guanylate cyclase domain-containing protein [Planctomycetales bacterium]|nr:adenylate/guanylate cyclase domain-containing protein [Planctomycetales bacterium]
MPPTSRNLLYVLLAPVPAQVIGSIFNTWYNISLIEPLLEGQQEARFWTIVTVYNLVVYPLAIYLWYRSFLPIRSVFSILSSACDNETVPAELLLTAQRRSIYLPWIMASIAIIAWFACVPAFLIAMSWTDTPLNRLVSFHLALSFFVAGIMATSQGMFAVELSVQRFIFPHLFKNSSPSDLEHVRVATLKERGAIWTVAAIICPIGALTLLAMVPDAMQRNPALIAYVGIVAMVFGLSSATLIGRWLSEPIRHLKTAAARVHDGNLETRISLVRADEFGPMISEFNHMVRGLGERQRILETFGQHVGHKAATQILARDDKLGGTEREITVMFTDIRGFTAYSESRVAAEVVDTLNRFFSAMVDAIERHGGMVNKFLGDGLMALFGADRDASDHAIDALSAAAEMLVELETLNETLDPPVRIGVGIHSGKAIVGSIGSTKRREYTAIGDTVNVASRIESMTKRLDVPLLISESVHTKLPVEWQQKLKSHDRQAIVGRTTEIAVYSMM